jgi:hypothetical protein
MLRTRMKARRVVIGVVIAGISLYLSYLAAFNVLGAVMDTSDPATALTMQPADGDALASVVDARSPTQGITLSPNELADAKRSLRSDPLNRRVLRLVGLTIGEKGDVQRSERIMLLANDVSRRDAATQLWMIERLVQRGDVKGAVMHYDIALRTQPELEPLLLPIFAQAIHEEPIRAALRPYIRDQVRWASAMLFYAILHGNLHDVVRLLEPVAYTEHNSALNGINLRLISALVDAGEQDLAEDYALRVTPGIGRRTLTDLAVSSATTDTRIGNLAWKLSDNTSAATTFNDHGGFDVVVDPWARGPVISRVISVKGGRQYTLAFDAKPEQNETDAHLTWDVTCRTAGQDSVITRQDLALAGPAAHHAWSIAVPLRCRALRLQISATGDDERGSASVSLYRLSLR